jgi:hypothetical protein
MATTLADTALRVLRTAAPALLALAGAGCSCPPLVESYATPESTLATWQARLCRDDPVGEYRCLAASLQRRMGLYQNYHAARARLLDENPATAWLFERADLEEHVELTTYTPDGLAARVELSSRGEHVAVTFELEAWLTVTWADGAQQSLRQELPLAALLGSQGGRQWLAIQRPELPPERLAEVRALAVESRWKIADISGLAVHPVAGAAAVRCTSPSGSGPLP